MSVVTLNLDLPAGQAPAGAKVQVWLAGTAGQPVVGYVAGKQIVGEYNVNLDTNGAGQLDLVGNDLIEPSGTVWGVRIKLPHGPNPDVFYIDVPSTGGPFDVEAVLAEAPGSLPSTALSVEVARAEAAEVALGARVDTETTNRQTQDGILASAIAAAQAASQPLDSDLTAIAALATTSYGRALLALADAAAGRTALGLGTAATHATSDFDASGAAAAAQAASQPVDADLTAIAALSTTAFGRALLSLADQPALLAAAGAQAAGTSVEVVPTSAYCDQTGATDAAAGLRLAAAAAAMSNLPLEISEGTLLVDSLDVNNNIVTLTQGIEAFGAPGATIKLGPNASQLRYVFGPAADEGPTDLSGLDVHDIIFDGSKATTPVDATNAGYHRNAVGAFNGDVLKVHDCVFKNWDGRQLVTFDGRVNGVAHVYLYNNIGIGLGGAYYHDASAFYVDANYVTGYGNHVVADIIGTTTPSNAGAAYEIHGHCVDWHDNSSENYQSGGNLVSTFPTGPQTDASSYKWHDNVALNCASALNLWPLVSMTDVDISRNMATISVDQWPTTGTNGYPNVVHVGVNLVAGNATVKRCRIEDNDWLWLPYVGTPSSGDCGVSWIRPNRAVAAGDTDITIRRNRFFNCPSTGVYVENFYQCARWDVSDNKFYNVGKGGLGENYQAGMVIKNEMGGVGAPAFGIDGLKFNNNTFTDDQGSHTLSYPLILSAGSSRTDACTLTNGSATVLDPTVTNTDLHAVLTGTGIQANTVITTIVPGVSFNMSKVATADGASNVTLTAQVALTRDVEMRDTTVRIADGSTIPLFKCQSTQAVYVRGAVPNYVAPAGNAVIGSELVDLTTGITWHEFSGPSGTGWAHRIPAADTQVTAGNYTINSTSFAEVDATLLRLTVPAAVGDRIVASINLLLGAETSLTFLDFGTIVGGAIQHRFSGASSQGLSGFYSVASALKPVTGQAAYTVVANDIVAGQVTVSLLYRTNTAANRTLNANANTPLGFTIENRG